MSLLIAKMIPAECRQARRYSCSSSTSPVPLSLSSACVIWPAVLWASAISSALASLRQQVRPTTPRILPETGWRTGSAAQARSSRCSA